MVFCTDNGLGIARKVRKLIPDFNSRHSDNRRINRWSTMNFRSTKNKYTNKYVFFCLKLNKKNENTTEQNRPRSTFELHLFLNFIWSLDISCNRNVSTVLVENRDYFKCVF